MAADRSSRRLHHHLLLPLLLRLLLLAACHSPSSAAEAERRITMTQGQFCKSCCATVEALFEYAQEKAKESVGHAIDFNAEDVAKEMCRLPPFPFYKEFFTTGCEQIVAKNLTTLVAPLMSRDYDMKSDSESRTATGKGESTIFSTDTLKFEHSKKYCREIGACPETFFKMGRETIKDKCKACQEFVWDFKVVLAREKEVTPRRVVDVLTTICEKLALLHLRPGRIEDSCEQFVEVWYEDYLENGDEEEFIHTIADNIDDIMVGRYDISTPICTKYTDACKKKKKKKKKAKAKAKAGKKGRKNKARAAKSEL